MSFPSDYLIDYLTILILFSYKETKTAANNETEEFSTPPTTPETINNSPSQSLSQSPKNNNNPKDDVPKEENMLQKESQNGLLENSSKDSQENGLSEDSVLSQNKPPSAPPRRREKKMFRYASSRPSCNGLPPTPKVHMGACFSKVFNECPLKIYCNVSWIHPETRDQHILLGCEEGIYTLNLNELHDACLDQLYPRKTTWLFVIGDVLMSLSGKTPHLYRHDLVQLHSKSSHRFSIPVDSMINKIPERFVPWKLTATSKIADTKGCTRCCVGRNPYNGYKYLCGVTQNGLFLMQWYNPLNKFMLLKVTQHFSILTSYSINHVYFLFLLFLAI